MREARQQRPELALDDVSANLAEVLRRADGLLAEWSAFGAEVKAQVEREASTVGTAVSQAVDGAVARAVGASIDRAVPEQLAARMAALTAEITKLEHRARTAAKAISDERTHDRRLLGGLVLGVLVANALLVMLLLRPPPAAVAPVPEATRVEVAPPDPAPAIAPPSAPSTPSAMPPDAAVVDVPRDAAPPPNAGSASSPAAGTKAKVQPSKAAPQRLPPRKP
ncbi:MAG: hypothetical protein SFX73_22625 [Kofleriaceae bacterium]|nr:hypothetical protein [Kofleriaceae bacterium]